MRNKGEENVYKDEGEGVTAVKRRKERKGVEEGRKTRRDQVDGTGLRRRAFACGGDGDPLRSCCTFAHMRHGHPRRHRRAILRSAATTGVRPYVKAGVRSLPTTRSLLTARCPLSAVVARLGSARLVHISLAFPNLTSLRLFDPSSTADAISSSLSVARSPPTVRCRLDIHQLRV